MGLVKLVQVQRDWNEGKSLATKDRARDGILRNVHRQVSRSSHVDLSGWYDEIELLGAVH